MMMKNIVSGLFGLVCCVQAASAGMGQLITELPGGNIKYQVTYAEPRDYVEVFVRRNDIQTIAQNIVDSKISNGDGTYSYQLVDTGYKAGDVVSTRFYSHANGEQTFTPASGIPGLISWSKSLIYTNPAEGSPYVTELADGAVKYTLGGIGHREYVELFVRKNGIQTLAMDITGSYNNGTYHFIDQGYQPGDEIEVRFYSHHDGDPRFFPGDTEQTWSSHTYGAYQTPGFATDDATYTLGQHLDGNGQPVHTQVYFDVAVSYLTPFGSTGEPPASWITDRAIAHSFYGDYLQNSVEFAGLYVRHCHTGEWINADNTVYAPVIYPLSLNTWNFFLSHHYANTSVNTLLDPNFACPGAPARTTTVMLDGAPQSVYTWGRVHFAYVVRHF